MFLVTNAQCDPTRAPMLTSWARRSLVPALALFVFAMMALLWASGLHAEYFGLLRFVGVAPFRFPFLDIHAVLAATECHRMGIDVYRWNPCDVLGRVHAYSPLWLTVTPRFLGLADTWWIGALLDVLFILSLSLTMSPQSSIEFGIFGLTVLSPVIAYALERANNDIIIFLTILYASAIYDRCFIKRSCCYFVILIAGFLKYYPIVLLILIAREVRRDAILYGGCAVSALLVFMIYYHRQLPAALANIPTGFIDTFSAKNLPWVMAYAASGYLTWKVTAAILFIALSLASLILLRRNLHWLAAAAIDWTTAEAQRLAIGAILIPVCFFAGTNIDYREIYFIFVIPGLIAVYRTRPNVAIAGELRGLIAAALFLMWEGFVRHQFHAYVAEILPPWLRERIEFLFWVGRELLWWWLIAALAAIAVTYIRQSTLIEEGIALVRRLQTRLAARSEL